MGSQCGGVPGRNTGMATHYLRSFLRLAKANNRTVGALFLDLKDAFYTVIRELVAPLATSAEDLEELMQTLEIDRVFEGPLREALSRPFVLEGLVDDQHLLAMVSEAYTNNWLTTDHADGVARSRRSTCPGTVLADIVFNLAFLPILKEVSRGLDMFGILWKSSDVCEGVRNVFRLDDAAGEAPISDSTFADDTSIMIVPCSNASVVVDAGAAARIAYAAISRRGFRVNVEPGKSAIMLAIRGEGARAARGSIATLPDNRLPVDGIANGVCLVNVQKSLGGQVEADCSMASEVAARILGFVVAMGPLRKTVFKVSHAPVDTKITFADALASSALTYNVETWDPLTDAQLKRMESKILDAYRAAARMPHNDESSTRFSAEEAYANVVRLPFELLARIRRLEYLPRLLNKAPKQLLFLLDALLAKGVGWPMLVEGDVCWAARFAGGHAHRAGVQWAARAHRLCTIDAGGVAQLRLQGQRQLPGILGGGVPCWCLEAQDCVHM